MWENRSVLISLLRLVQSVWRLGCRGSNLLTLIGVLIEASGFGILVQSAHERDRGA